MSSIYSGYTHPTEAGLPNLETAAQLTEVIEEEKARDWDASLIYEENGGLDPPDYIEQTQLTEITKEENADEANLLWEERGGLDTPAQLAEVAAEEEADEEDALLTYERKGGLDPPEYIALASTNISRHETRNNHEWNHQKYSKFSFLLCLSQYKENVSPFYIRRKRVAKIGEKFFSNKSLWQFQIDFHAPYQNDHHNVSS